MTIIPNNSLSSNWKPLALSVIGRGHAATRPLRALEAGQSWLEMDSMAVLETKAAPLTAAIMVVAALDRLHICATHDTILWICLPFKSQYAGSSASMGGSLRHRLASATSQSWAETQSFPATKSKSRTLRASFP